MSIFESGLSWTLYKYMETDFLSFLEYVPYVYTHRQVYSPKLLSLLMQICGYIDSFFKEMAKFDSFRSIPECMKINQLEEKDYRGFNIGLAKDAFEKIYRLSTNNQSTLQAKLIWLDKLETLSPFKAFGEDRIPDWWTAYNDVKHKWSESLHQANMQNTLEALAGAFLLNVVHYPSIKKLWEMGQLSTVIKVYSHPKGLRTTPIPSHIFQYVLDKAIKELKPLNHEFRVETELFIYDHISLMLYAPEP